jgi:perosamine synthetase
MVNGKPKFVDIEEETLGLDPKLIEKSISKDTKAIVPIHYAGSSCKIEEITEIAKRKKIPVIEDAAESLGCKINKKKIGSYGIMAVFSFAGNKVLTSGEGGAIVTNSKKLYEKLKLIRSHGRSEVEDYFQTNKKPDYVELGYNWRMSSITAAIATSQLKKIDKLISLRRKNAEQISSKLRQFEEITVPGDYGFKHAYQLYTIRLKNNKLRNELMKFLTKRGIMSKIYFDPVHKTPFYKKLGYSKTNLPITDKVSQKVLSLPIFPKMKPQEINLIVRTVEEFMKKTIG